MIDWELIGKMLGVPDRLLPEFVQGVMDGVEQGPELSTGMTYENEESQTAYDAGTHLGAAAWAVEVLQDDGQVEA